jgi:NADH-quinone oxidoreductase subunit C
MVTSARPIEELRQVLAAACGQRLSQADLDLSTERGDLVARIKAADIFEFLKLCKESSDLCFNLLVDVTAVDWMDAREHRFEVVYQLLSLTNLWRLTVKVSVGEGNPEIASATPLWNGANFLEREVWDMFGIRFVGHPDLRRILMYEEFVGHPLRKDYPLQAKQPRIPLRMPEVENTARQMHRPDLVTIRSRRPGSGDTKQEAR